MASTKAPAGTFLSAMPRCLDAGPLRRPSAGSRFAQVYLDSDKVPSAADCSPLPAWDMSSLIAVRNRAVMIHPFCVFPGACVLLRKTFCQNPGLGNQAQPGCRPWGFDD